MPNFTRLTAEFQIRVLARLITRMGPENAAWLARRVMRDRGTPRTQAFAAFSQQCVEAWKNRHYDVHLNGEAALLAALAPFKPAVLFDVGANIGDWSLAAAELVPNAHLHAFEITPATAEALAVNAAPFGARLTIHPFGLGDHEGEITVYLSPRDDTANSTLRDAVAISSDGNDDATIAEVAARITTGDAFLAEHGIAHLDFLKIDVEGAEFSVLNGFQNAFARNAIDLVQFEYGEINLKTRDFLEDYYKFFTARGFVVGKLYPEGVMFKEYTLADEDFLGPNYIACRAERTDLIAALRFPDMRRARV